MKRIAALCILLLLGGCKTTLTFVLQKNLQPDTKTEMRLGLDDVFK